MKQFILFLFVVGFVSNFSFAQDTSESDLIPEPIIEDPLDVKVKPAPESSAADAEPQMNPEEIITESEPVEAPVEEAIVEQAPPSSQQEAAASPVLYEEPSAYAGDILLETQTDITQSYKKRRGRHGILFSVTTEKFYPKDYFSLYQDQYIEKILGDDKINLVGAELGYKYNFSLGSLGFLLGFARGGVGHDWPGATTSYKRSLDIQKVGASANFAMDNLFEEPLVVPYIQGGIHQFQVYEDDLSQLSSRATTASVALNYRVGLLFQLNWIEKSIDPNTQLDGLRSSGLQNAYIDVFASSYLPTQKTVDPLDLSAGGDPDLSSNLELGAGLKIEF